MVVDDHLMVRKGLALLVSGFKDMELVGEAPTSSTAIKLFQSKKPDVTLMDLMLPDTSGAETIRRIRQIHPDAVFIALTSFGEEELVKEALRAGARGFLYKDVSVADLADAIRQTCKGRTVLDPKASKVMMHLINENAHSSTGAVLPELSERETDVLKLLVKGMTNKQISAHLQIQPSTVKQYVAHILSKMKVKSRAEAAVTALRLGLIEK
jgi:NarL family two-component system response regulator LiaR